MRSFPVSVLLAGCLASARAATGLTVDVSIDATVMHQVMDGFGCGHQPRALPERGDVLTPSQRARAIAAVYGEVGLTTGYLDTAVLESPGSYEDRTNDNADPFTFAWSGFQTFRADTVKTLIVDPARSFGFTDYLLAERINVRWASPWMAAIRSADRNRYLDEAAEQVAAGLIYWRDTYGVVPAMNLLFNEPLSGNGELSSGSTREVADLIARTGARLRGEGFAEVRFLVPNEETVGRAVDTAATVLADAAARPYVGAIGYHPYPYGSAYASISKILATSGAGQPVAAEVAARNQLRDLARQYGIPAWMTEISHGGVDSRSFAALRGRAIHIHDELVYADAAAYLAYGNMWDRVSHQEHFGNTNGFPRDNEGFVAFIDQDADTVTISGLGYAIGHYARWVKKGAVRIDAASSDPLVQVTAFRDDGRNRLALVLINNAAEQQAVRIAFNGVRLGATVTGEQSTANAVWQALAPPAPSEGGATMTLTLPAESVTSLAGSPQAPATVSAAPSTATPLPPATSPATVRVPTSPAPTLPGRSPTPSPDPPAPTATRAPAPGDGDANCDGTRSVADATALQRIRAGGERAACERDDPNGDGRVDQQDLDALITFLFA